MRIALIGAGNTSSSTLLYLLSLGGNHEILLIARNSDRALAALLDAASAFPQEAQRVMLAGSHEIKTCDIILLCAGTHMAPDKSAKDVLKENAKIAFSYLHNNVSSHAHIVLLGIPVDKLTVIIAHAGIADKDRIIGFGGDLDTARLKYILAQEKIEDKSIPVCIGEHGARTIPVYGSEDNYEHVTSEVRGLLKRIIAKAGEPRNFATGVWLSKLAISLTQKESSSHNVCAFMPEFELYLTWPRLLSSSGILSTQQINRKSKAAQELTALITQKRSEQADLVALGRELSIAN